MPGAAPATIFIVDDDPGLLRLVEKALRREGFTTATAGSGREALDWLARHRADLMLLDLKLEDIGGMELVRQLVVQGLAAPFVIITGQGDERVAVEMMKRGALDYLVKDVQFIQFVPTVVRRALEQVEKDQRLVAAQAALKESREQLLAVSEREQTRFGAELHDGLGQQLTAIELRCQSLRADLPPNRSDLKEQIAEISQYLREAIAQTRSLARGLAPVNLGSGGLIEALGELAARMSREGMVTCALACTPPVPAASSQVEFHLFRIAQEAVNNAVKHSGAREVVVRLAGGDGTLRLEIADDGQGLPNPPPAHAGIGLQIMRHRASVIGAALEIISQPGQGVTVSCVLQEKQP